MLDWMLYPRNTTVWKLGGAETFRLSSAALFGIYGTNLTNIEKEARKIYWADKGRVLVQNDQAGAEALIVAYLCKKGRFRELFDNYVKPHTYVALNVFRNVWKAKVPNIDVDALINTPISNLQTRAGWKELDVLIRSSDGWSSKERYYFFAKQMCHSLNYDAREFAFRMNVLEKSRGKVVLSKQQSQDYIIQYHSLFPEIHAMHREVAEILRATGMLYNMLGYPMIATSPVREEDLKEWYAKIPQSTVGCITHIAITKMQDFIEDTGVNWDVWNNNHDSLVTQCPESEALDCARKSKEFLEQDLVSPRGEKFKMRSEIQVGHNWSPYHETKNPEGLKEIKL